MPDLCCCASAPAFLFVPIVSPHCGCLCAHSVDRMTDSRSRRIHPPHFINLVVEPMEAIHAELVRLAAELEAVKGQVQTECNALRDPFARTTTAMSSSVPQHHRRLNHREAGRHLPQQFGGSRLDYGDFAFRMEGCAAVQSRDGQGGALLREVAKLETTRLKRLGEPSGMFNIWVQLWQLL